MARKNVVVLVPGLLGFGRLGAFYYFADRVSATLRGALEARVDGGVTVVGVSTLPADSLAARQRELLRQLAHLESALGGVDAFHLVGHSTGGVDAHLLTCERPLTPGTEWTTFGPEASVREKLASVCTLASPHYGTFLADSELASFLRSPNPFTHFQGALQTLQAGLALTRLLWERDATRQAAFGITSSLPEAEAFLWRLLSHRELLSELSPARMVALRRSNPQVLQVPVSCFVTVAPTGSDRVGDPSHTPDSLFRYLHELTGSISELGHDPALRVLPLLQHEAAQCIRNPALPSPTFSLSASDGIVNSTRQVLLDLPGQSTFVGMATADHADVLGRYDRMDVHMTGKPLNGGLFRSGAGFGDDQFFALFERIADRISEALVGQRATPGVRPAMQDAAAKQVGVEKAGATEAGAKDAMSEPPVKPLPPPVPTFKVKAPSARTRN